MRGIFVVRRIVREGKFAAASYSSSNTAVSYTCMRKPSSTNSLIAPTTASSVPKFQSAQPSYRNFCSSSSGQSKMVLIESEDQLNSSLRKVHDESLPALFYFTAVWCGPCRLISPIIGQLSEKYPNVATYKIDIDQEGLGSALSKLNITAVPTLHFFNNGEKVSEVVGADVQRLKDTMETLYK